MPDSDFLAALRALREGGVEFAVVGGLAAVLNGAPVNKVSKTEIAMKCSASGLSPVFYLRACYNLSVPKP